MMMLRTIVGVGLVLIVVGPSSAAGQKERVAGSGVSGGVTFKAQLARTRGGSHRKSSRIHAPKPSPEIRMIAGLTEQLHDLRRQVIAVQELRQELRAVRQQVTSGTSKVELWGGVPLALLRSLNSQSGALADNAEIIRVSLPDLHDIGRLPASPRIPTDLVMAALPAVTKEEPPLPPSAKSALEEARTYLIRTATPGYTMTRQGVELAIDRLHPGFVVKLAEAIRQAREAGMSDAGVFSAYRPPAYRIGGFKDKFNSLHSYGLAVDMTGIGRPGSSLARLWFKIVTAVGLYLPYGPRNHHEFNHTQFVAAKMATSRLRITIAADGPKDLGRMWLASGSAEHVQDALAPQAPELASARSVPVVPAGDHPEDNPAVATAGVTTTRAPRRRSASRTTAKSNRAGGTRGVRNRSRSARTKRPRPGAGA